MISFNNQSLKYVYGIKKLLRKLLLELHDFPSQRLACDVGAPFLTWNQLGILPDALQDDLHKFQPAGLLVWNRATPALDKFSNSAGLGFVIDWKVYSLVL